MLVLLDKINPRSSQNDLQVIKTINAPYLLDELQYVQVHKQGLATACSHPIDQGTVILWGTACRTPTAEHMFCEIQGQDLIIAQTKPAVLQAVVPFYPASNLLIDFLVKTCLCRSGIRLHQTLILRISGLQGIV